MKVEIDLPEIPGYEYTGEYRAVKRGEFFLDVFKRVSQTCVDYEIDKPRHILRKKETPKKYRPFKDYDEMKPHRERWVMPSGGGTPNPLWWYATGDIIDRYDTLCSMLVFEDTGEPVGVEE